MEKLSRRIGKQFSQHGKARYFPKFVEEPVTLIHEYTRMTQMNNGDKKVIHSELSYQLNGIFFEVQNNLGRFKNEKQYSDAIEDLLKKHKIQYQREYGLPQTFNGEKERRNIVDFLIEDKIVIEIKTKTINQKTDYYQLLRYLSSLDLELGILVNFRRKYLVPKRILNPSYSGHSD